MTIKECFLEGHKQFKCRFTGHLYTILLYDDETDMFCYKNKNNIFVCDSKYRVEPVVDLNELNNEPLFT